MDASDHRSEKMRRVESGVLLEPALRSHTPEGRPLAERMALYGVPGVSVAVIADGEIEWAKGYGLKEACGSQPVTDRTLFQACSVSKPVTAVAVMRLAQEGILDLDWDVNEYLRSWKVPANGSWQPKITLRQLLSHTAGTTVHGVEGYRRDAKLPSLTQVLEGEAPVKTPPVRVSVLPGVAFRYSGGGSTVVQQVLEDIVGQPFPKLMRELVLEPLGMEDSTYEQPLSESRRADAAVGHHADRTPLWGKWNAYAAMAAAGLWTTPRDLCFLAIEVQRALREGRGTLLTRETAEQMLTPQPGGAEGMFGRRMGIGFFLLGKGETLRFGHGGDNEGFKCEMIAYARRGMGAVVMTNHDHGTPLCQGIIGAVAREYGWPLSGGEHQDFFHPPREHAQIDPPSLAAHVGEYELRSDLRLHVTASEDSLALRLAEQPPMELFAKSETEYYAEAVDVEVRFLKNEANETIELIVRQDGHDLRCRKLA
jgi:CubicO group peptidase (beta-lactamase class C family)